MDISIADKYTNYFERVYQASVDHFGLSHTQSSTSLYIVIHAFDNIFPYLETLQRHFHIAAVVFKGSREVHKDVVERALSKGFPVRQDLCRTCLKQSDTLKQIIEDASANKYSRYLVCLDYGGYLCDLHQSLSSSESWQPRYLGVIEGTENGHQRYRRLLADSHERQRLSQPRPVVSGARSLTKNCYDAHIGQSLIEGSAHALHYSGNRKLTDYSHYGVLGYGKIGRSTALYLRIAAPNSAITVCELDAEREKLARQDGFEVVNIRSMLANCEFIFSITGSAALNPCEFDAITNSHKIIACGTSSDDELGFESLLEKGVLSATDEIHLDPDGVCVSKMYKTRSEHSVELLGDGRTINTLVKSGSQHPTLALTEGCHIAQIFSLLSHKHGFAVDKVNTPDIEVERLVFQLWREHFIESKQFQECLQLPMLDHETVMALTAMEEENQQNRKNLNNDLMTIA